MTNWTTEPPTEPGHYWWRKDDYQPIVMRTWKFGKDVDLTAMTTPYPVKVTTMGGEWWPLRIEEPGE